MELKKHNDPLKDMMPQLTSGTDLATIIKSGTQVSKLRKEDPITLLKVVILLIEKLIGFFKTKRGLEEENEIIELAEMIIKEYWYLKVEEISYCFEQAKLGAYNKAIYEGREELVPESRVLDRLDGSIIMMWLKKYDLKDKVKFSEEQAKKFKERESEEKFEALSIIYGNIKNELDLPDPETQKLKEEEFHRQKIEWARQRAKEKLQQAKEGSNEQEVA